MKNLSLILNGILFVLVGILFYRQYKEKVPTTELSKNLKGVVQRPINFSATNIPSLSGKIVFVDYDSLVHNYDLFKKLEKELEEKLKKSEQEMLSKQKKLEEGYQSYMQGQSMMTDQHKATKEKQLTQQNQELVQLRDEKGRQFSIQEQQLNEKLLTNLYSYFHKLAKEKNFSYIFSYKRGIPGIVYGVDSLNITSEVIVGLNKEYRNKK